MHVKWTVISKYTVIWHITVGQAQMSKMALLAGFSSYTNLEISFRGCYSKLVFKKKSKELQAIFFFLKFSVISALSQFGMKIHVKDWNIKTLRQGFFFSWSALIFIYTKSLQSNRLSFWKPKLAIRIFQEWRILQI